jgi:succinyl-CoA synthetase alpha subunit
VAQVAGYEALLDVITGTMPASDRSITVPMVGEEATKILGGGRPTMIIEDERTALGIDNAVLGSGEIIE